MKSFIIPVAAGALIAAAAAADVTLPKGTSIEVKVLTAFDSDHTAKGKAFQATVLKPLYVGGRLAIPRDAAVVGEIKHVRALRDGAKSAAIAIKFETLNVGGKTHDIDGVLTTFEADQRKKILEQEAKVRRAQQALNGRRLYAGEASGVLDEPTRRAIAAFQIDRGQPATGDLDDVTAKELAAAPR